MIQPLPSARSEWMLLWVELDDPMRDPGGRVLLPTLVMVCDARGVALGKPLILPELDQLKVEGWLLHLFQEQGKPELLAVARAEEWDEEDWKTFAEDHGLRLRLPDLSEEPGWANFTSLPWRQNLAGEPAVEARALLSTALQLRSPRRREHYLRKVVELDAGLWEAQIELADMDFGRGEWKDALERYEEIIRKEEPGWGKKKQVQWWEERATRPYLRACFGRGMVLWHQGQHRETAAAFGTLLQRNPRDHQGVRFFIPLVLLLAEEMEEAAAFYEYYRENYESDFVDPAFYFGWGLILFFGGDEVGARRKYQMAMMRNVFLAPMLLEEPEPEGQMWFPNERAEPSYAAEFVDSYAPLWDRDAGALRAVREAWLELRPRVDSLIQHRQRILDFQDQRYEKEYRKRWEELVTEEQRLTESVGDLR
jgi:tetratricopeptide (TPR) repeat protein